MVDDVDTFRCPNAGREDPSAKLKRTSGVSIASRIRGTPLDVRPAAREPVSGGAACGDAHHDEEAEQKHEPDRVDRRLDLRRDPRRIAAESSTKKVDRR
jgi:hypothetical protein